METDLPEFLYIGPSSCQVTAVTASLISKVAAEQVLRRQSLSVEASGHDGQPVAGDSHRAHYPRGGAPALVQRRADEAAPLSSQVVRQR